MSVAVIILTHNEERHIARALQNVKSFASEIFVVDSFSTDRTVEVALAAGAQVLSNAWTNYSTQFQWALENAPISSEWIMRLDADEVIEPLLANEIVVKLPKLSSKIVGVNLKRKHIFLGRWIRHGGRYPLHLMRIWRTGHGRIEDRWMDEHIVVSGGSIVTFDNPFSDNNLNDLGFFTDKHNKYATREAVDVLNDKYELFEVKNRISTESTSFQASAKRFIKERIYNSLPFPISALGYFLFRYFLQGGFLDGREGLIYHVLQGFWYRFLVGCKVTEFDRQIRHLPTNREKVETLSRITALKLTTTVAVPDVQSIS